MTGTTPRRQHGGRAEPDAFSSDGRDMTDDSVVTLPGGRWQGETRHREASVRPLTGEDEVFVAESLLGAAAGLMPAQRTTRLLARCVTRLGPERSPTEDSIRGLTVGDREALLLHLRRVTLGDRLACLLTCREGCGRTMDLDLAVSDLLLPAYPGAGPAYERTVGGGDDGTGAQPGYRVRFRLPTGADQEVTAPLALADPDEAAGALLRRCVERVVAELPEGRVDEDDAGSGLPAAVARWLPGTLAELDPQAQLVLNATCPECGRNVREDFDAGAYFFAELASRVGRLFREVHVLALNYHWSEGDILAMTHRRRQLYLDLLSEARGEAGGL